jgi:hypothetical protein
VDTADAMGPTRLEEPNKEGDGGAERLLEFPAYAEMQGAAVLGRAGGAARIMAASIGRLTAPAAG